MKKTLNNKINYCAYTMYSSFYSSVVLGFSDFLVPFLYFLWNFIVHSFANAWARMATHRLITAFNSLMLCASYVSDHCFPVV